MAHKRSENARTARKLGAILGKMGKAMQRYTAGRVTPREMLAKLDKLEAEMAALDIPAGDDAGALDELCAAPVDLSGLVEFDAGELDALLQPVDLSELLEPVDLSELLEPQNAPKRHRGGAREAAGAR